MIHRKRTPSRTRIVPPPRPPADKEVALNLRGIPFELRNSFKSLCALKGASMQDEIMRFMAVSVEYQDFVTDRDYVRSIEDEAEPFD